MGYIDYNSIPDSEEVSDNTLNFSIQVNEGPQYRMGKLAIFANKELEEKLRAQWDLAEGAVFDENYVEKYFDSNRKSFPSGFSDGPHPACTKLPRIHSRDSLPIDSTDPRSQVPETETGCESPADAGAGNPNE